MAEIADLLKTGVSFLRREWFEKAGLAVAVIVAALVGAQVIGGSNAEWWVRAGIAAFFAVVTVGFWLWSRRPPKTQPNKVGVLVAITCENDEESQRVRSDFLIPLQRLIRGGAAGSALQFIDLPQHIARHVITHEDAELVRIRSRAHFMLFGHVRKRPIDGVERHVLDLEGIVAHKPVPLDVQKQFAAEFSELLPRRVLIDADNDSLAFQFTSEWAEAVAKYVIGIAAYMSGDLDYAERLYLDVQGRLTEKAKGFPIFRKLSERLPIRLSEVHHTRAELAHVAWRRTGDPMRIADIEEHLSREVGTAAPLKPGYHFLSAIVAFLRSRDISAAIGHLRNVKNSDDPLWNLNMGFLAGYKGNLKTAARHYRAASEHAVDPDVLLQVEEFVRWVLERESDKYQLWYCLALFYWKVTGDKAQARRCFRRFLDAGNEADFPKERELAGQWLADLERGVEAAHV